MTTTLLKFIAPYAIAFSAGFTVAFSVQGIRIDAARNETVEVQNAFVTYHNLQVQERLDAEVKVQLAKEHATHEYDKALKQLSDERASHAAYRRCVAAGRCDGLRRPAATPQAAAPDHRLPGPGEFDGAGADTVPAAGESAPQVIDDCASTTLRINQLQSHLERVQRGHQ